MKVSNDFEINLNFFIGPRLFFKKYQNCNLSFLKKHTSNEFQIEGDKSHEYPLRIYIHENIYQSKLQGSGICLYWQPLRIQKILFCTVFTKNCIALSQSDSIIIFLWYIISIEKLNTNRTCVLNILLNYDFAFNIGQSNLIYCDKIVTKLGTSCAFFIEWLISKISQVVSAFELIMYYI